MTALRLLVGLGNPGSEYRDTRHNLGFRLVDGLAARWRLDEAEGICRSRLWRGDEIVLAQPQTFMNRSGWAVECLLDALGLGLDRMLVALDDVALPLGTLRLRARGGPGGHRGLESIVASARDDAVPRLRLGIAPEEGAEAIEDLSEFVLSPFSDAERSAVEAMLERAVEAVELWCREGIDAAMNRANG